jgi:hypothetical protein
VSVQDHLFEQYANWRQLTRDEGAALSAGDWNKAASCQEQKAALRQSIDQLTRSAKAAWAEPDVDHTRWQAEVRRQIEELMALEQANQVILARHQAAHLRREADLGLARRNLGQVHRSYSQHTAPTWQSYS